MPDIKTVIVEEEDPYGPFGAKSVRKQLWTRLSQPYATLFMTLWRSG